ncbi:MAG: flagellar biosynthesis protein [Rubrivivax sp.]|nr:flagellar biosynthesis protein [Rubrivivax sp.]
MRDFYASSRPMPLDQADGLRRLFAGRRSVLLPLAANPHVAFSGSVLDRLAATLAAHGRRVLVVDAGAGAPLPPELARVDLAACIETVAPRVSYLPARGLPLAHVDTRGSAAGFIDALQYAAPEADVLLLHADGADLARLLKRRAARPVLLAADHPESVKHAYANAKLLAGRCALMTFDLLLAAAPSSPRLPAIVDSLAGCTDRFLGAVLRGHAVIDPAGDPAEPADAELSALLAGQLALDGAADADDWAPPLPAAGTLRGGFAGVDPGLRATRTDIRPDIR